MTSLSSTSFSEPRSGNVSSIVALLLLRSCAGPAPDRNAGAAGRSTSIAQTVKLSLRLRTGVLRAVAQLRKTRAHVQPAGHQSEGQADVQKDLRDHLDARESKEEGAHDRCHGEPSRPVDAQLETVPDGVAT